MDHMSISDLTWQATTTAPAPFAHQHDIPDEAFRATLLFACNGQLPIQAFPLQRTCLDLADDVLYRGMLTFLSRFTLARAPERSFMILGL